VDTKILIVADEPDTRNQLARSLAGSGFRVFAVPDGAGAVLQFGLILPDLVILDIPPAGKERWKPVQRIREMSPVPVIVLVASEDHEGKSEGLDWGADSCLTKPFDLPELQARVRALLRRVQYAARSSRRSSAVPVYSRPAC
jgi:DNA-binding response OmpR family regulator